MSWRVDEQPQPNGTLHVWPHDDVVHHDLYGIDCICLPRTERHGTVQLVVHAALDREQPAIGEKPGRIRAMSVQPNDVVISVEHGNNGRVVAVHTIEEHDYVTVRFPTQDLTVPGAELESASERGAAGLKMWRLHG